LATAKNSTARDVTWPTVSGSSRCTPLIAQLNVNEEECLRCVRVARGERTARAQSWPLQQEDLVDFERLAGIAVAAGELERDALRTGRGEQIAFELSPGAIERRAQLFCVKVLSGFGLPANGDLELEAAAGNGARPKLCAVIAGARGEAWPVVELRAPAEGVGNVDAQAAATALRAIACAADVDRIPRLPMAEAAFEALRVRVQDVALRRVVDRSGAAGR